MKKITIFLSIFLFSSILFEVLSADMNTIKGLSCSYVTNNHFTINPKKSMDDVCLTKFECCYYCYIKYVEEREERWLKGWRPDNG